MFVTLLINFHTLQIGVYCMGVGGGGGGAAGYRMSGYNMVVGVKDGCLL